MTSRLLVVGVIVFVMVGGCLFAWLVACRSGRVERAQTEDHGGRGIVETDAGQAWGAPLSFDDVSSGDGALWTEQDDVDLIRLLSGESPSTA